MMEKNIKVANSVLQSAAIVMPLIFIMTFLAELNAGFKDWLTDTFSHHWIGKSIVSLVLFIIVFLLLLLVKKNKEFNVETSTRLVMWSSFLSAIAIFVFFWLETALK